MTNEPMRRPFLLDPGETIFFTASAPLVMTRRRDFMESTGLTEDEVYVNPILALPLPVYPQNWTEGHRRWSGVKPEAMWNPLLWLPRNLRAHITGDDYEEPYDVWAMRVALQLTDAGLYDPASGLWGDILHHYGLDVDNPMDLDRIQDWLDGNADPILDVIDDDLDTLFPDDETLDALRTTIEISGDLQATEWSLIAQDIDVFARTAREELDRGASPEKTTQRAATACWLAAEMLDESLEPDDENAAYPGGWRALSNDADDLAASPGIPREEIDGLLGAILALTTPTIALYQPVARNLLDELERVGTDSSMAAAAVGAPVPDTPEG